MRLLPVLLTLTRSSTSSLLHRATATFISRSSTRCAFILTKQRGCGQSSYTYQRRHRLRRRDLSSLPSHYPKHKPIFRMNQNKKFTSLSSSEIEIDGEKMSSLKHRGRNDDACDDDSFFPEELNGFDDDDNDQARENSALTSADEDGNEISLPKGLSKGYHIISHATVPSSGFSADKLVEKLTEEEIKRLEIAPANVTVPVAIMMLFPKEFATLTKARKECRRKKIIIIRRPVTGDAVKSNQEDDVDFDPSNMSIGRVGDRVLPFDTVAIQTRTTNGSYDNLIKHHPDPPFHLPVVYQDDHIAIVNKPEGVIVFGHKNGGYGRNTVKSTLPYVLNSPKKGTLSVLWNPLPVHRIDLATSGLLIVAKTKPAMVHLSQQFRERKVKKTYTAILNGIPPEPKETSITSAEAEQLGVCIDSTATTAIEDQMWQLIDKNLEDQSAVTVWRSLGKSSLENAFNGTVTMVELKPKTGRFHQLRRHMAWVCNSPIIGDKAYDGAGHARQLREEGLFLCSNKVTLEHPFYNTQEGKSELDLNSLNSNIHVKGDDKVSITEENDGTIMLRAEIQLPEKFRKMMKCGKVNST